MPREIVTIQVGQCGNQMGLNFWQMISKEHRIGSDGRFARKRRRTATLMKLMTKEQRERSNRQSVYFDETGDFRYTARCVLADLETSIVDRVMASEHGPLFGWDSTVTTEGGSAGNNFAKGYYTSGNDIVDTVLDKVRMEVEKCDCIQGLKLLHSLGGGTGSGLGSLILSKLADRYPTKVSLTFSVYPSSKISDVIVEPYNTILSMNYMLENTDETFIIDNEGLFLLSNHLLSMHDSDGDSGSGDSGSSKKKKQKKKKIKPSFLQLNTLVSHVISGITCSLRFPGISNSDLRKIGVNLVPFPRLHFFTLAHSPLYLTDGDSTSESSSPYSSSKRYTKLTIKEITSQLFKGRNYLAKIKLKDGKYLSTSINYRGNQDLKSEEIDRYISDIQNHLHSDEFVEWIPNNIKSSIVNDGTPEESRSVERDSEDTPEMSATLMANTTAVKSMFSRISSQFSKMFKRKAFTHWYKDEGMDEMEFLQSNRNVRDLIAEYQDRQDVDVSALLSDIDGGDFEDEKEEE